jgi:hypothetical protein
MKKNIKTILIAGIALCIFACKKSQSTYNPSGMVNVTNAVIGGSALAVNNTGQTAYSNSYVQVPLLSGDNRLKLYVASTSTTPSITYYDQPFSVATAGYYSLFLTGISPTQVDAVLINESYKSYTDSTCGVRFINLSPNSGPISVNIQGAAQGSEVSTLAYKAYTTFKQHPAKMVNANYVFEIRDAGTGNLITTYTMFTPWFQNVTLALRGLVGGTPAAGIILDKDY